MTCADCGMPTPNHRCRQCRLSARAEERARQREYDDEEDEVRTDGGLKTAEPTFDTPLSYQARCGVADCRSLIGMSDNYCGHCGVEIDWPDDHEPDDGSPRKLLTGGGD